MISIIIFTLIVISTAQVCPPREVLHPCRCINTDTKMISCSWIQESFNLKEVMDNASPYINDDVIFDTLFISGSSSLSKIEEAAFQHLKFHRISIYSNKNLTYISPRAFNASREITREIVIQDNPIENETPNERDIFDLFKSFKNLQRLTLTNSLVSSIPDWAFQNMTSLEHLWVAGNSISSIGRSAFSGIPRVNNLWLQRNSIRPEGVHEEAFYGISGSTSVSLYCNKLDYLEQKRFQPLLDRARLVFVSPYNGVCPDSEREYAKLHCDCLADWICDNEEKYKYKKLLGYRCKNGTGYEKIWDYCRGRKNTYHSWRK